MESQDSKGIHSAQKDMLALTLINALNRRQEDANLGITFFDHCMFFSCLFISSFLYSPQSMVLRRCRKHITIFAGVG